MTESKKGINISILGRDFSVACAPEQQDDLLEAARTLDAKMKDIQKSGKIIGSERVAIMTALNVTNDFLKLKKATANQVDAQQRLIDLQDKIDGVLQEVEGY